jgi:hypothetical protein
VSHGDQSIALAIPTASSGRLLAGPYTWKLNDMETNE